MAYRRYLEVSTQRCVNTFIELAETSLFLSTLIPDSCKIQYVTLTPRLEAIEYAHSGLSVSENIALDKVTTQSSYYRQVQYSSLAVDGNLTQGSYANNCIHTATMDPFTWWQVDIGREYYIHKIAIHFRTDYSIRRNGVEVYSSVDVNQTNTGHPCGSATSNSSDVTWIPKYTQHE
ncbi:uncharacterized protein LOC121387183 [Gigantopelta aegis]|uniref:uncharacterized protein LOC121387183 n=1 Tax=Gigantopelta aegis TaxID=1735272 RepID=UPI001B88E1FD|nr:uncharacterized protein LOC121387183 [Gigantopelta aegis]